MPVSKLNGKAAADPERSLVQALADTEWRLLRIPTLEAAIYALRRLRRQREKDSHPTAGRASPPRSGADQYISAVHDDTYDGFDPAALGFEFSVEQIRAARHGSRPNLFAEQERALATKKAA